MTTTVTTVTRSAQVLTRTWSDLDTKVRNALYVWALTIAGSIGGLTVGRLDLAGVGALDIPVTVALIVAYVTTSKHRAIIQADLVDAGQVAHDLAPIIAELAPAAGPAVAIAMDAIDTINAALTPEQTDLSAVTATATDPSPTTEAIAAAALPTPVGQV